MSDPNDPKNWTPFRAYFEAFRKVKEIVTGPQEHIPEVLVRDFIAKQRGIKPEEVTWEQIRFEVSGLLSEDYPAIKVIPSNPIADEPPTTSELAETDEVKRRRALLETYKAAAHVQSNKRIYEASNSGVHKPQFYQWLSGVLPADSSTTKNFERFLREQHQPIKRRKPQN